MIAAGEAPPEHSFSFRSDRLCLDFAATLMFRETDQPQELLDSPAKLSEWALASGTVSVSASCGPRELSEAIYLREAIYRLAITLITRREDGSEEVAVINRHGRRAPVAVSLSSDRTVTRSGPMAAVLASIARDAIELLGGPEAPRLRQCRRDGCTRMFVDRSHGRNRTWCGMRECGNRVNAAAYRRRKDPKQEPS